jgi:hypothetical protein
MAGARTMTFALSLFMGATLTFLLFILADLSQKAASSTRSKRESMSAKGQKQTENVP